MALGNPSEAVPPGGATRVYLNDDGWEQELMRLAGLRGWLTRRRVRRSLDALTGAALIGFAGKLATDAH